MATAAEGYLIKPDRRFAEAIVAVGGSDLKRCFQCATCSVVCGLSSDERPFPRKEMQWAQWGLREQLFADPDIWRCHQCNDCSTRCPRGARPGDVLAAVRQLTVRHYAVPRLLATWLTQVKLLPAAMLVPAVLLALALLARAPLARALSIPASHEFYAAFFPDWLLIGVFSTFTGLALVGAVASLARFWRAMRMADGAAGRPAGTRAVAGSVLAVMRTILVHDRFAKCTDQAGRRSSHLLAFYGFAALFIVTGWAVIDLYVNPHLGIPSRYPFNLLHPMKLLANAGALALILGVGKAIVDRGRRAPKGPGSTPFDWLLVWLLLSVGVTGVAVEALRFVVEPARGAAGVDAAYSIYFLHLVLVFSLLVYLPYSKFAHLLYRTVALVYAEWSKRSRDTPHQRLEPRGVAGAAAGAGAVTTVQP